MTGTPPSYSLALAERLCQRVAEGESLAAICAEDAMPAIGEVIAWQRHNPEFAKLLDGARQARAEIFLDQVLEMIEKLERGDITVAEAEVTIEGLKMLVETSNPDAYGPRSYTVHEGEIKLILPDGTEALLRPSGLTVTATGLH